MNNPQLDLGEIVGQDASGTVNGVDATVEFEEDTETRCIVRSHTASGNPGLETIRRKKTEYFTNGTCRLWDHFGMSNVITFLDTDAATVDSDPDYPEWSPRFFIVTCGANAHIEYSTLGLDPRRSWRFLAFYSPLHQPVYGDVTKVVAQAFATYVEIIIYSASWNPDYNFYIDLFSQTINLIAFPLD